MEGGPSHLDTFDRKPLLNELAGQKLPSSFKVPVLAMGESDAPLLGLQAQLEAVRPERPVDFRLVRTRRPTCRRPRRHQFLRLRRHQPRRRRLPDEHRLDLRRAAFARRLGELRPRHREPEPAGLRRHQRQRRRPWSTACATGAAASCRPCYQGRRIQLRRTRRSSTSTIPKDVTAERQRDKLDLLAALNRDYGATRTDNTELEARIRGLRTRLPHAGRGAARRRSEPGNRGHQGALRHGPAGNRRLWPQLPAGPPAGRKRRPLRAALQRRGQQVGQPRQARREPQQALPRRRQADRRPARRLESSAACSTRPWSSGAANSAARR